MNKLLTGFHSYEGFKKAEYLLKALALPHEILSPDPGFNRVGVPAVAMTRESRSVFLAQGGNNIVNSGWVDHRDSKISISPNEPETFNEDAFGRAAMMVLAPCMADPSKIRTISYITGNLTEVFPYMNAEMRGAAYNPHGHIFTFMEGYRMVSLYPQRIAVAKADEIVDAWRVLEMVRVRANTCWKNRGQMTPSYEMRKKPPALEIYFRLPKTNCKQCGEKTCLAFALRLWSGETTPHRCQPVFAGDFGHLKDALLEICQGLGVTA